MPEIATALVRPGLGRSEVHRARAAGPLRLLCPRGAGDAAWIVTSSLGGGLVHGDAVALDVTVEAGATCVITTQASTKVYKGTSSQHTTVRVRGDGAVLVVPDPVVPFRAATFAQRTHVELDAEATLVMCDVLTAGRIAFGERWSATRIDTTLSIDRAGIRLLHDRVLLHGEVARSMRRFEAIATAVLIGPRVRDLADDQLARLGVVERGAGVVVAASPLADGGMFRIAGDRVEHVVRATRDVLHAACARVGEAPWSRKW